MKLIKIAGASLNQTPFAWDGNKGNILEAIRQARGDNVSILCLPELCISGYGCEDMFLSSDVIETSSEILGEILPYTSGLAVGIGLPLLYQNKIYDSVAFVVDRKVIGFVPKKYLAGDGLHYEPRWFKPWPAAFCWTPMP